MSQKGSLSCQTSSEGIFIVPDQFRRDLYRARPVQKGFLSCQTCFDTGFRFTQSYPKDRNLSSGLSLTTSQEYRGTFLTRYTLTSFNPSRFYLRNPESWSRVYAVCQRFDLYQNNNLRLLTMISDYDVLDIAHVEKERETRKLETIFIWLVIKHHHSPGFSTLSEIKFHHSFFQKPSLLDLSKDCLQFFFSIILVEFYL